MKTLDESAKNSVEQIRREQTFPLRIKLLRPGGTVEDVSFAQDLEPTAVHFGCFRNSKLVSVATIFRQPRPGRLGEGGSSGSSWQLRGMATDPDFQGFGCGKAILLAAIDFVRREKGIEIWCNARVSASHFYAKSGFRNMTPDTFDVPGIGPHYVMNYLI